MSLKNQALRDLVVERLAVAADEIFALFERTLVEYEEEFLRSKLLQEPRVQLTGTESLDPLADCSEVVLPVPLNVHQSPETIPEEQQPLVKEEVDPSLEHLVSTLPVKSEEDLSKPTLIQPERLEEDRPEPIEEPSAEEEPGCSLDLHGDNSKQPYSCTDTDDSEDWESETKRQARGDEHDPDLVLIEDSDAGRDDDNELLSFGNFSGSSNTMIDLQTPGFFNLPIPHKTGEKRFRCALCGRDFDQRAQLRSHMQTHATEPLRCSVCSKEFSQRAHLKRHMQSHSAEKSFSCPECGLRLKQQHNMHRHISAVHRREKPYSCLFCQKAFAQKSDFIIHMRTHTGEKPFVCAYCRKGFRVRASLNKHIQKAHAGV